MEDQFDVCNLLIVINYFLKKTVIDMIFSVAWMDGVNKINNFLFLNLWCSQVLLGTSKLANLVSTRGN